MPIRHNVDSTSGIVHIVASGATTEQEWLDTLFRPVAKGMINMLAVYVQSKNVQVRMFQDTTEALVWLKEHR
jgi:hypothetical protein